MRIFYNETIDRLLKRLVPGLAVAGLAAWGVAYGGPELESVPGMIPMAEAVQLDTGETAAATGALAAVSTAGQGGTSSDPFTDGTYQDGTYTGTAQGFGGSITVRVTISGGKITAIDIVSAAAETPSYFARAKGVIATYSSNGIIIALKRALTKAAGGSAAEEEPGTTVTPSAPDEPAQPDAFTDGTYRDGIYTGTAEGYGGDITVSVTVADGKIHAVDIVSAEDETPSYLEKAKAVIAQVLDRQTPNVDTVSGATYSSNGILNAIRRALSQAAGEEEQPETPEEEEPAEEPEQPALPEPEEDAQVEELVYTAEVSCVPDEFGDFEAYTMTVAVTVRQTTATESRTVTAADGTEQTVVQTTVTRAIADIAVTEPDESSENWRYISWALDGRGSEIGIKAQAVEKQSFDGLDAVSRATCSSDAIAQAGSSLALALGTTVTEEVQ